MNDTEWKCKLYNTNGEVIRYFDNDDVYVDMNFIRKFGMVRHIVLSTYVMFPFGNKLLSYEEYNNKLIEFFGSIPKAYKIGKRKYSKEIKFIKTIGVFE